MQRIAIGLSFTDSGYIGKPYWPELNVVINVMKDVHKKLGEAKKAAAILASAAKQGYTREQYAEIVKLSQRPFYTMNGSDSEIIIPERVFQSFLNNTSQEAPKAVPRIASKGLTFIGVKVQDGYLRSGKTAADALRFERFVKNDESNQRMFVSDQYIIGFQATGIIRLDEEVIKSEELKKLVEYGGRLYGIGSARPQGYGRFTVSRWEKLST